MSKILPPPVPHTDSKAATTTGTALGDKKFLNIGVYKAEKIMSPRKDLPTATVVTSPFSVLESVVVDKEKVPVAIVTPTKSSSSAVKKSVESVSPVVDAVVDSSIIVTADTTVVTSEVSVGEEGKDNKIKELVRKGRG